ncbi:MAG: 50S ribosomal protein L10 [Candidatus Omnitrophota bacterium]
MAEKYGKKVKEVMIKEMKSVFSENPGFVFSSFERVKATEMDALRRKLKLSGSQYLVLKNRIGKIALKEAGLDEFSGLLEQKNSVGIGVIKDDPVKIAKVLIDFAKTNKGFKVANGYLEGQVITSEKIKELSQLPGREQLIAMVLSAMNAPIAGFVGVLSSLLRNLCNALNAVKEKKEKEGK